MCGCKTGCERCTGRKIIWGGCRNITFIKCQESKERHAIEEMKIEGDGHERGWEKTEKEKFRSKD